MTLRKLNQLLDTITDKESENYTVLIEYNGWLHMAGSRVEINNYHKVVTLHMGSIEKGIMDCIYDELM